jgi:putative flippase GtrA
MHHASRRAVIRSAPELRTLVKFTIVGGSGYLVNLVIFALVEALGAHYVVAAVIAFLGAVCNNFHWNRRWTFRAVGAEAIHHQARRFFTVSVINFLVQLGILHLLVSSGMKDILAQAISVAVAMPVGFVGNRMWTFHEDGGLRVRWAARRRARLSQQA